ncbi:TPA: ABC transporter permease [Bacillus cereus]|nr:ABC transporter permease [Bacillus cereus]
MTFRQFAIYNVVRNRRIYIGYFLSCVCAVLISFIYCTLAYHPYFSLETLETLAAFNAHGTSNTDTKALFQLAQIFIMFFSFLFILYSLNVFYNHRRQEFGILMVCGMSPLQLRRLIFIENLFIGFCANLAGIGIGLLFMKIILLISKSIFSLQGKFEFYFPIEAIKETSISFFVLFILVSFFAIGKSQLVGLEKSGEVPKSEPKPSIWLSLLAIILISVSYVAAFYLKVAIQSGTELLFIAGLFIIGVLGTYFLFTQLSFYVIATIKKKEPLFFRKTNLLTISELSNRMKDNVRSICLMSILMALACTTIGIISAFSNVTKIYQVPYAFSYTSYKGNIHEAAHISQIKKNLDESHFLYTIISPLRIQKHMEKPYYSYEILYPENIQNDIEIIKLTDYNKCSKTLGYPTVILKGEEDSIIIPSQKIVQADTTDVLQKKFLKIELKTDTIHINLVGKIILFDHALSPLDGSVAVVSDSVYNQIKNSRTLQTDITPNAEYRFYIRDWGKTAEVLKKIANIISLSTGRYFETKPENSYAFYSKVFTHLTATRGSAQQTIISVLLGGVFFAFAMGFLYFRLFANFEQDNKQYQILLKLGLTQQELKRIITQQIGILFIMPLIVAIIHSSVALLAIRYLLFTSFYVHLPLMKSSIVVFGCVFFVQIFFLMIIRRSYFRQVFQHEYE